VYKNDAPLTDDFVEGIGTISLIGWGTYTLGERVDFDGNVTPISSLASAPPANSGSNAAKALGSVQALATTAVAKSASGSFRVAANTTRLMLTTEWSDASAKPVVEIQAPNGRIYSTARLVAGSPVFVINELSGPGYETFGILKPTAGIWTIRLPDAGKLAATRFEGYIDAKPTTVVVNSLAQDASGHGVDIAYSSHVGDSPAKVSFFYTDTSGSRAGMPIAFNLPVTNGSSHLVWDTANVRPGVYYIYAMTDDGKTPLSFADAQSSVVLVVGGKAPNLPTTPSASPSGFGKGPDAFVTTLYNEVLGRAPEPAGLFFWSKQLISNVPPKAVATSFLASRERSVLQSQHKAPPISLGHALSDASKAWKQATKLGATHPTGKAGTKLSAARLIPSSHR
jgi:Domain of unknown function (DUF4214)